MSDKVELRVKETLYAQHPMSAPVDQYRAPTREEWAQYGIDKGFISFGAARSAFLARSGMVECRGPSVDVASGTLDRRLSDALNAALGVSE